MCKRVVDDKKQQKSRKKEESYVPLRQHHEDIMSGGAGCLYESEDIVIIGERSLWRAVITQALMDAGSNSMKKDACYERAQAIAWLAGASPDFHTVCSLADMDTNYIKKKAKEAIKRGCMWRKDATSVIRKAKASPVHKKRAVNSTKSRIKPTKNLVKKVVQLKAVN